MDKFLIRKDVFDELIEKGYGKRDLSKLQKVQITDKNGHRRNVYKKNGVEQKEVREKKVEEITPEKKARYEEMLEKVKAGPDENALSVKGKMLNKEDAIAHLEGKLGKKGKEKSVDLGKQEVKDTFKSKTEKYKKMGLDDRASAAIVAIAEIEDEIKKTPDSDIKKLEELDAMRTDVQVNGLNSKWVKQRMSEDNNSDEGNEKEERKEEFENKMSKFKKWGLDTRSAAAKVAIDEIEEQIRNTSDDDQEKLEELAALRTDVQLNGLKSKYIKEILG